MLRRINTKSVFDIESGKLESAEGYIYDGPVEECSFVNRLAQIMIGQGVPVVNDAVFLKQGITLSGTALQTTQIPATGGFTPPITKGKVRLKFYTNLNQGTNPKISTLYCLLSDGVNFVDIGSLASMEVIVSGGAGGINQQSASIPNSIDRVFEFEVDGSGMSYLFISSTLAGTNPVVFMDVEVSGTV